jgi:hypothetical protein
MQQTPPLAGRAETRRSVDFTKPELWVGEQAHVAARPPRPPAQVRPHRRAVDPLEHDRVVAHLDDRRDWEAVLARVPHDACLAFRKADASVAPQHRPVTEVDDFGFASSGQCRLLPSSWCARKKFSEPAVAIAALAEISNASVAAATIWAKR